MDASFVTERVATGAAITDPHCVSYLLAQGITHVINCRAEFDDKVFLDGQPIKYLWCPTNDDGQPKGADFFGPGIKFALDALAGPNVKVYAHCAAGVNRGPSMAYAILRAQGFPAQLANLIIKTGRPIANIGYAKDADKVIAALGY